MTRAPGKGRPMDLKELRALLKLVEASDVEELEIERQGQRVRIRFIGANQFAHPMHLHGFPFKIAATDGFPVPEAARLTKDTVNVDVRVGRCPPGLGGEN